VDNSAVHCDNNHTVVNCEHRQQSATSISHLMLRLHLDRTHVAGYKLYPLVAVNMFLVSATKLSPVCRPSVAGYKGIQVDRDINE